MEGLRRTASFSLGLGFPSAAPTGNCPCLKEGKSHCCRQKQPEDSHEMGRSQKGPPKPLVAGPALLSCPSFSGIPFEPLDSWTPHRASETEKSPASCLLWPLLGPVSGSDGMHGARRAGHTHGAGTARTRHPTALTRARGYHLRAPGSIANTRPPSRLPVNTDTGRHAPGRSAQPPTRTATRFPAVRAETCGTKGLLVERGPSVARRQTNSVAHTPTSLQTLISASCLINPCCVGPVMKAELHISRKNTYNARLFSRFLLANSCDPGHIRLQSLHW